MRVGLLLAGISFGYKSDRDFRHCFPNISTNLIEPLKKEHEVVTFITTYEHEHIDTMNELFRSEFYGIVPYDGATQLSTRTACLEMVDQHYDKPIDFYIMTRFDVHFNKPLDEFNLDFDKFNIIAREGDGYWQSSSFVGDTFFAWPRSLHEGVKAAFDGLNAFHQTGNYDGFHMHNLYWFVRDAIGDHNVHFMFDNYQLSGHELTNCCTKDYADRLRHKIDINKEILERFPEGV